MSPHHQSKPAAPQRDTSSPTCVSSHNIPIERSARRVSIESTEHLGEFYDQATWRMYERIQSARRELQYRSSSGQSVEMPCLDDRFKSSTDMTRLHQRRRNSLGQQQQQEEQETDYFDDAIFDMDM